LGALVHKYLRIPPARFNNHATEHKGKVAKLAIACKSSGHDDKLLQIFRRELAGFFYHAESVALPPPGTCLLCGHTGCQGGKASCSKAALYTEIRGQYPVGEYRLRDALALFNAAKEGTAAV